MLALMIRFRVFDALVWRLKASSAALMFRLEKTIYDLYIYSLIAFMVGVECARAYASVCV